MSRPMSTSSRVGLAVLGLLVLAWVVGLCSGYDVIADVHPDRADALPDGAHWLGTDHLGRDVFWRLVLGTQAFMLPAGLAAGTALALGVGSGAWAGAVGGMPRAGIRYLYSVVGSLPRFVLVLLFCAMHGQSSVVLGLSAGLAMAPTVGEAVHGRVRQLVGQDFVLASRVHGTAMVRIVADHLVLRGCRDILWRSAFEIFAFVLILEATLSYLGGFGLPEPYPSWGNMLAFEFGRWDGNPWARWAPALAIWCASLAAGVAGRGLAPERSR
jgi:peptide/nickel transport system permease protein